MNFHTSFHAVKSDILNNQLGKLHAMALNNDEKLFLSYLYFLKNAQLVKTNIK